MSIGRPTTEIDNAIMEMSRGQSSNNLRGDALDRMARQLRAMACPCGDAIISGGEMLILNNNPPLARFLPDEWTTLMHGPTVRCL
jgi:hypothetical protein